MHTQLMLGRDDLLNLGVSRDTVIEVTAGAIWFTLAGEDVVLGAGQKWIAPLADTLLVQAMLPSSVQVRHANGLRPSLARMRLSIGV